MWISSLFQTGVRKLFILSLVSLLAACGGGGGGGKKASPAPASASPISSSSRSALSSSVDNSVSSLSAITSSSISSLNNSASNPMSSVSAITNSSISSLSSSFSSSADGIISINSSSISSLGSSFSSSMSSLAIDTTPDAFSFTAVVTGALNTPIISNFITVSGINTASPISVSNGEYSINGGAFTSASGTVSNGQTIVIKLMSAATVEIETQAVITIGGIANSFSVTTTNLIGGAIQNAPLNIAGVVTTFAGGKPGVDGTGVAAKFQAPTGITTNGTYLYVADTWNYKIRKIEMATGVVTTLAGSGSEGRADGTGAAASFNSPAGITTDGTYLYVADTGNHKIRTVEIATGVVTTLAGSGFAGSANGTGAAASFDHPVGITIEGAHLYVSDAQNHKIRQIEIATGVVTTLAGSGSEGSADGTGAAASFDHPVGITTDGTHLYVTDSWNYKIRKIEIATGVVSTMAGSGSDGSADGTSTAATFSGPRGITSDGTDLYVTDGTNKIRKIRINTGVVTTLAGGSIGNTDGTGAVASFNYPTSITSNGTVLYVTDAYNHNIRQIVKATGVVTTLAGSGSEGDADGAGVVVGFNYPEGIATDGTYLYVADTDNYKIRKVEIATSIVTTLAGSGATGSADGTGAAASFSQPQGITTDGTYLYVADSAEIRKIEINTGVVTTLAGSGFVGSDDGTGPTASFYYPYGITTDGTYLYVADTGNHKIRKVEIATGVVTTLAGHGPWGGDNDGTGTTASFNHPEGITTDGTHLYVADTDNGKIRKIEIATGVVTTLAGSNSFGSIDGTGATASFYYPYGITTDGTHLYVADSSNNKIRKIEIATGVVTTLAGGDEYGSDDGVGTAAKFRRPSGITTDGFVLFVTDTDNNTIRKIE